MIIRMVLGFTKKADRLKLVMVSSVLKADGENEDKGWWFGVRFGVLDGCQEWVRRGRRR